MCAYLHIWKRLRHLSSSLRYSQSTVVAATHFKTMVPLPVPLGPMLYLVLLDVLREVDAHKVVRSCVFASDYTVNEGLFFASDLEVLFAVHLQCRILWSTPSLSATYVSSIESSFHLYDQLRTPFDNV